MSTQSPVKAVAPAAHTMASIEEVEDWKLKSLGVSSAPLQQNEVEAKMKQQEDSFNPIDQSKRRDAFRNYKDSARQEVSRRPLDRRLEH